MSDTTEEQRQIEMHRQCHKEIAEVTKKYLKQGIWRPLVLGVLEDIKMVTMDSYLNRIRAKGKN